MTDETLRQYLRRHNVTSRKDILRATQQLLEKPEGERSNLDEILGFMVSKYEALDKNRFIISITVTQSDTFKTIYCLHDAEKKTIVTSDKKEVIPLDEFVREFDYYPMGDPKQKARTTTRAKRQAPSGSSHRKEHEFGLHPALYQYLQEKKDELRCHLYCTNEYRPKTVENENLLNEIDEKLKGFIATENGKAQSLRLSDFLSLIVKRRSKRVEAQVQQYLKDTGTSFVYNFPEQLKEESQAPEVIKWIDQKRAESGEEKPLPFYVRCLRALNKIEPNIATKWLRIANCVEFVKTNPHLKDFIPKTIVDDKELMLSYLRAMLPNRESYAQGESIVVFAGAYGLGLLEERSITAQRNYPGAANYLMMQYDSIDALAREAFSKVKKGEREEDLAATRAIKKEQIGQKDVNTLVFAMKQYIENDNFKSMKTSGDTISEGYETLILQLYVATHIDTLKQS